MARPRGFSCRDGSTDADSVALSSKWPLAPSDRTPSCIHKLSRSTLTGLSFIFVYSG